MGAILGGVTLQQLDGQVEVHFVPILLEFVLSIVIKIITTKMKEAI